MRPALLATAMSAMIVTAMLWWMSSQHRAILMAGFDTLYEKLAADEAAKMIFEPQYQKGDIDA